MEPNFVTIFAGGLFLGIGTTIFLLVNGRVLGVSGILGGFFEGTRIIRAFDSKTFENCAFLLGLMIAPGILAAAQGIEDANVGENFWLLALAGLLIGLGARMANGCTSGHSISGTARFSPRSFIASILYLIVAIITYAALHHGQGLEL